MSLLTIVTTHDCIASLTAIVVVVNRSITHVTHAVVFDILKRNWSYSAICILSLWLAATDTQSLMPRLPVTAIVASAVSAHATKR